VEFPNIPLDMLGQYGIAYIALAVLIYVMVILAKILIALVKSNNAIEHTIQQFAEKLDALSAVIDSQTNMLNRLERLIEDQSRFTQRMLEKLDVLWDIAVKRS